MMGMASRLGSFFFFSLLFFSFLFSSLLFSSLLFSSSFFLCLWLVGCCEEGGVTSGREDVGGKIFSGGRYILSE